MASHTKQVVRLAGPVQLAKIATQHPLPTQWPPPDTHIEYVGPASRDVLTTGGALLFDVVSDSGDLPASGFYWTTLGNLVTGSMVESAIGQAALLQALLIVMPAFTGQAAAYPVYFEGQGNSMRWLRCTIRGSLTATVEQFQFHTDIGNPGADPDINEAQALALAEQLKGIFTTAWNANSTHWDATVKFVELGVVQIEATSATDSQGNGGNAAADWPTQWTLFPPTTGAVIGMGAGPSLPFEVALAVSLQTDHRGPSGRGRYYLPPPNVTAITYGGVFADATVTEAKAQALAWLEGIKSNTPYVPIVVSPRRLILNEITSVGVGKVPDSQRRRRRSQDEVRTYVAVA